MSSNISSKYPLIAAAVTLALASTVTQATVPLRTVAAAATQSLVIAGSSAAQAAAQLAIEVDLCGEPNPTSTLINTLTAESSGGSKNFYAFSCNVNTTQTISNVANGSLVTIYYRTEGGSVVSSIPTAKSGNPVLRLDLTQCTGESPAINCPVNGTSFNNGPTDSFSLSVTRDIVHLGVADVEPTLFTGNNFPLNTGTLGKYNSAVYGNVTTAEIGALQTSPAFQQVFGLAVNTSGGAFTNGVNLTKEAAANILSGSYVNWNSVPDALTGNPVTSTSLPITLYNRETGSGTRTQANAYYLGYLCNPGNGSVFDNQPQDYWATGDVLTQTNSVAGAITYSVIDQLPSTKYPNLVFATLNGVLPSNLAAATGQYDEWFEAKFVRNFNFATFAAPTQGLANFMVNTLPALATGPVDVADNVIPFVSNNTPTVPLAKHTVGTISIYINPYTRSGNSCAIPAEQN